MQNTYKPEGHLIDTLRNRELCSTVAGLEYAMLHNIILEGIAMVCDSKFDLHIGLGECEGIISRDEVMYCRGDEKIKDIAILTRVGKPICFKVMGFEQQGDKLIAKLSRSEAQRECFDNYLIKLRAGDIIPAKATHLENFGAFVDIGCGMVSLLSVDCISVSRISHPRDRIHCGMDIMTIVKSIDYTSGRIYVTHRELLGTWEQNAARFTPGQTVAGIVRSVEPYGIFVELTPNLAGLAELRDSKDQHTAVEPGQWAAVYIKNIIPERMKVKLVLIDTNRSALPPSPPEYFIDTDKISHLDVWRYSPACSNRLIETVFC
ncbi:MAG: S1 RNA-binding domain-containing protein [Clostridia bacterium]|nr:S1 RNA-binding domain-containing protein [Clostridia bacterium]